MFTISAAGTFYVDWGDGTVERVFRPDITTVDADDAKITHTYDGPANTYTIRLSGRPTRYNHMSSAISFNNIASRLSWMDGCLGCVFPTINNNNPVHSTQPQFRSTFQGNTGLNQEIPPKLFDGLWGKPYGRMFIYTFSGCSGLHGPIPDGLFGKLSGRVTDHMFQNTFTGCSGLNGTIPENLFAHIQGAPLASMFSSTFEGTPITTIPEKLFSGISGAPVNSMFPSTFRDCKELTSIPENLFDGIDTTAPVATDMFTRTFGLCGNNLTGPSARIKDEYLYNIWPDMPISSSLPTTGTYSGDTNLTDWADIPRYWK